MSLLDYTIIPRNVKHTAKIFPAPGSSGFAQRRNTVEGKAAPSDTNEYERTDPDTNEYDRTETYTNDTKGKDKDKGKDRGKDFSKDKREGKDRDAYAPVRETARRFRAPIAREECVYDVRGSPRCCLSA